MNHDTPHRMNTTAEPENNTSPHRLRFALLGLLFVLFASSTWIVTAQHELGATFDEPFYTAKGLTHWRTGSYRELMRAGTMPLPVDVQTLPLYLWERERGSAWDARDDLPQLLPIARKMNLIFWWLLLVNTFRFALLLGGPRCACLAVGLLGFEPNFLAHACLATTDIAIAAAVMTAAFQFLKHRESAWFRRVGVPGFWYGIALLCKASALLFVPLLLIVLGYLHVQRRTLLRDLVTIGFIGFGVMFLYVNTDAKPEPSFIKWANGLPDGPSVEYVRTIARELCIFPNAGEGLVQQIKHNMRGHGCFVLGEWHPRAVWYYFPIIFSQKLSEPLLLLLALAVWKRENLRHPLAVASFVLLVFSLTCRVQIGIRLMLPTVCVFILFAAYAARTWPKLGAAAVLAMMTIATLNWPDGLQYQNRLWGSSETAREHFTDSNYDWGQGLPQLKQWMHATNEAELHVWYYGGDPAILKPPFRWVAIQHEPEPSIEALKQRVGTGTLAVSDSFFTGCPDRRPATLAIVQWLRAQKPAARVNTFTLYRFR